MSPHVGILYCISRFCLGEVTIKLNTNNNSTSLAAIRTSILVTMPPSATDAAVTSTGLTPRPLCQIVTPVGMLGYGFNEEHTELALHQLSSSQAPTALILDSGSTDSGPSKLALGSTTCPRSSYKRDIRKLLRLSVKYKVPVLISSAGGDGTDEHVDLFMEIIREIADEDDNRQVYPETAAHVGSS